MSFARTNGRTQAVGAMRWRRWLVVGLSSMLLHALALNWIGGNFRLPAQEDAPPPALRTVLVLAHQPENRPLATPPTPRPASLARAKTRPPRAKPQSAPKVAVPAAAPSTPVATATAPALPEMPPAPDMAADAQAAMLAAAAPAESGFGNPGMLDTGAASVTQSAPAPDHRLYKVDPPPSATLKYKVQALREGREVFGHGTIAWQFNGSQYAINGDAGILFFSLLEFSSHGKTDEFGIAPLQYTEKRFRRQQTETRFDREHKLISFSASANTFPLQGGEQDRASIVWQLASIGRGDAARFAPDTQVPLFIAGVRDGSTWNIQVLGEEEIEVGLGRLRAWHVRRAPRPGDKDQILDIWLAPSYNWYPVRLRYTETNGEYLDLSLSAIEAAAATSR
ncbi:DUF3108 domain-containing protein [Noviherbaspirillum sedimenti]|uniref:DUF3108 domain-containing protein n=1 Tax=Noviherbaspirillum sedimenti TaxID=2320865 RepID=A0A3A3G692_9BURK|nr:DUF3108 domain-containing protein [Noviherbaspirillum sedimenti]RJG03451.1 DUF3108 domain-containing protein [Noviherbaspirillum sedimenti]